MTKDRVYEISGWRFAAVFILLGLMFLLADKKATHGREGHGKIDMKKRGFCGFTR